MKRTAGYYGMMALTMVHDINSRNEVWKEEILVKWKESTNLPRKKKKLVRKGLLLDWSIASWNPLDYSF